MFYFTLDQINSLFARSLNTSNLEAVSLPYILASFVWSQGAVASAITASAIYEVAYKKRHKTLVNTSTRLFLTKRNLPLFVKNLIPRYTQTPPQMLQVRTMTTKRWRNKTERWTNKTRKICCKPVWNACDKCRWLRHFTYGRQL